MSRSSRFREESRLAHFRDLLSQLEREYVMILGAEGDEDEHMSEWFPPVCAQSDAPKEMHLLQHAKRSGKDSPKEVFDTVVSMDDPRLDVGFVGLVTECSIDEAGQTDEFGQPVMRMVQDLVEELEVTEYANIEIMSDASEASSVKIASASQLSVQTRETFGTVLSAASFATVFPKWWNPDGDALKQLVAWSARLEPGADKLLAHHQKRSNFVCSPLTFPKLHWDMVGYTLMLYVAWVMPFQLAFGSEALTPDWMNFVDVGITAFFMIDVLLNFNTGFAAESGVNFDRRAIVRRYLQRWFFFDLLTCFPFGILDSGGAFTTRGRLLQALKGLKPVRFIRLVLTMKLLQTSENAYFNIVTDWKRLFLGIGAFFVFLWNVHLLTCIWSSAQPTTWKAQTFAESLHVYFDYFAAIFLAVLTGSHLNGDSFGMQMLEMSIAMEHVLIIVGLMVYVQSECRPLNADAAKERLDHERALRYLRLRGVSLKTQINVMQVFVDCQGARAMQNNVAALTGSNVPPLLQWEINIELWYHKLMTMGLIKMITTWNEDFCHALAMFCQEEVFATGAILFNVADCATAAYHVVNGEFKIMSPLIDDDVPNFAVGTWLGEDALVNPAFRRGLRAVAVRFSSVMAVPSSSFQNVLHDLNLSGRFDVWVKDGLWRGLCGRCGRIGSHFHDRCSLIRKGSERGIRESISSVASGSDLPVNSAELRKYLRMHNLWSYADYLRDMGVFTLSDLQELDIEAFRTFLSMKVPPVELTRRDAKMLSRKYVNEFETKLRKGSSIVDENLHFIFLSHYKHEAGTEAALMLSDLEQMIDHDDLHVANKLNAPVFLDSEDLTNLVDLQQHVRDSMNIVLLLTEGVLSRPWCLVELVTASQEDIPVFPILVDKSGTKFQFPNEAFYVDLVEGKTLNDEAKQFLDSCGIDLDMIEESLRGIFNNIALPYSPHRSIDIRTAELQRLLYSCSTTVSVFSQQSSLRPVDSTPRFSSRPSSYGSSTFKFSAVGSGSSRLSSVGTRPSFGRRTPSVQRRSKKRESSRI